MRLFMFRSAHSSLTNRYPRNGAVKCGENSSWWDKETVESQDGYRFSDSGNFIEWFSRSAFGGTNYSNTPVGAVSYVEEPGLSGVNEPSAYFALWARGKYFAICAWNFRRTPFFQAVGDPLITR